MKPTDLIPWYWKAGAALALVAFAAAGVLAYGAHKWQQGHDAAVAERAARDAVAILQRTRDNAVLSIKQDAINTILTRKKDEELAPVRSRIAAAPSVRVGPAICPSAASTIAQAKGPAGGDGADSPSRLVRPDVDRDIRALKLAVEEDLATGRACQKFLHQNGLD